MKHTIEVEIKNIEVDEFYFSFDYTLKINDKVYKDTYSDDWCNGMSIEEWKEELEKTMYPLHLVLEMLVLA